MPRGKYVRKKKATPVEDESLGVDESSLRTVNLHIETREDLFAFTRLHAEMSDGAFGKVWHDGELMFVEFTYYPEAHEKLLRVSGLSYDG